MQRKATGPKRLIKFHLICSHQVRVRLPRVRTRSTYFCTEREYEIAPLCKWLKLSCLLIDSLTIDQHNWAITSTRDKQTPPRKGICNGRKRARKGIWYAGPCSDSDGER